MSLEWPILCRVGRKTTTQLVKRLGRLGLLRSCVRWSFVTEQSQVDLRRSSWQAQRVHRHRSAEASWSDAVAGGGSQSVQQCTETVTQGHQSRHQGKSALPCSLRSVHGITSAYELRGCNANMQCNAMQWLVAWHSGRTLVFDRRTFPVPRSTCSWRVTTYVGKPSAIGQPTRPTQPFILPRSINWVVSYISCVPPHLGGTIWWMLTE